MNTKKKIKAYYRNFRSLFKNHKIQELKTSKLNHMAAELIRNTHSIEKGLSIENPRLGFGCKKQSEMMNKISILSQSDSSYHREACEMAVCAMKEYLEYHFQKGYSDEFCKKISTFLNAHQSIIPNKKMGGTMCLNKCELKFNVPEIEKFFNTRHSVRDFEQSEVDRDVLKKALELAQRAPSACNRQGVRVYVLDKSKSKYLLEQFSGIGGFAEAIDKFVLITGKTSSYRVEEDNQYIVSASMYAAYLTLTLHLYGLGACAIQRNVMWNAEWEKNKKVLGVQEDEQLICVLAVGNLKESCVVPLSHRMQNEEMIRFL